MLISSGFKCIQPFTPSTSSRTLGIIPPLQSRGKSTPPVKPSPTDRLAKRQRRFLMSPAAQLDGQILTGQHVLDLLKLVANSAGKKNIGQQVLLGTGILLSGGLVLLSPSYRQAFKLSCEKTVYMKEMINNLAVLKPLPDQPDDMSFGPFSEMLFLKLLQLDLIHLKSAKEIGLKKPL